MKASELKAKWDKDIEKDTIREMNMDEERLGRMPLHLHLALNRDEIRLRDKEKK